MKFLRRLLRGAVAMALLLGVACRTGLSADAQRPNILFILADDLGWTDLGCYGNRIFETPNLDRLAGSGIRFAQAYAAAPICSASRASLLTGKTPARLGFEFVTKSEAVFQPVMAPLRAPRYTLDLPLEEITMAEALGEAGYQTAFFGKWHLNRHYQRYLGWSPTHGPKAQGFEVAEEDFGSHPYSYWSDKSKRSAIELPVGVFPEDSMTQRAVRFLKRKRDRPFFLMVSHFFVHTPVHTRIGWLRDRYLEKLPMDQPRREQLAHYGAMVTTLDHYVGQLLDALNSTGLAESTLVVFTSDNGGHPEYAGNAPLRGSKWNLYEGGIRVPFVVRPPGKATSGSRGTERVCEEIVSGTDLFPTFAEVGGAVLPGKIDGRSINQLLNGSEELQTAVEKVWHFPYYHPETDYLKATGIIGVNDGFTSKTKPQSVVRSGPWKLIHFYEDDRDELYHLPSDSAEANDRRHRDSGVARRLRLLLDSKLAEAGARMPVANPDWKPE